MLFLLLSRIFTHWASEEIAVPKKTAAKYNSTHVIPGNVLVLNVGIVSKKVSSQKGVGPHQQYKEAKFIRILYWQNESSKMMHFKFNISE